MYKPDRILESKTAQTYPQQTFQNSQIENPSYSSFCSPFRKHLPIIYETEGSPHQSFDTQKVDYLKSQYESRLIAVDEQLFGSRAEGSIPNDSRMLNQRQKQLLNKIYEKEKQLVMLENKLHLLKNSNQCLRDTIKEDQLQKQQLNEQIYKLTQQSTNLKQQSTNLKQQSTNLKQQSNQLKQQIAQLDKKMAEMQQKMTEYQTEEKEEQQFFREYDMQSRSIQQLHSQNVLLKKEIQQLKAFYEQQFYRMLESHQETVKYLEQRIKRISEENSELEYKAQQLSQKLLTVNKQKKDILSYYLKLIQDMKKQISPMYSNPVTVSQNFLQQDSYEPKSDYSHQINKTTIHQNTDFSVYQHNNSKSFDIGKYIGKVIRNGQKDKSRSRSKHNNKSRPKSIHKSESVSEMNYLSMNINMESNPKLNTTLMSYKYTDRVLPTKRYKKVSPSKRTVSPIAHHSILSIKMPISSFLSKQMETPRLRTNPYAKKYQQIDRKLQIIKDKITKQITY